MELPVSPHVDSKTIHSVSDDKFPQIASNSPAFNPGPRKEKINGSPLPKF